jgi:hypothetical protein
VSNDDLRGRLLREAAEAEAELAAIDAGEVEAPTPVRARLVQALADETPRGGVGTGVDGLDDQRPADQ